MGNLVLTGSKDCQIFIWDIRSKNITSKLDSHKKEVCGVRWSIDGSMIASGDNNNMVEIWDVRGNKNLCKFKEHVAAVKALAWSPHQNNILSTGGGTSDKSIRVWNIH
jgi:WD40 repeat protein